MTRAKVVRASLSLLLACTGQGGSAPAEIEVAEPPGGRVPPAVLPAELAEPPAPAAPLPPGTPEGEGSARVVLALDDQRALVSYSGSDGARGRGPWLALMRRDGSLDWVQPFPHALAVAGPREAAARVDDVISLLTWDHARDEQRLVLRGLSLVDGAPRFAVDLGVGAPDSVTSDGSLRLDTMVRAGSGGGEDVGELVASSAGGVSWRARIEPPIRAGYDPTAVGDVVAVRSRASGGVAAVQWTVFDRRTGVRRKALIAELESCSDGRRWFVRDWKGLIEVDAGTLTTRRVLTTVTLPGASTPWEIEDCVIAGDAVVVLVERERRRALVALDMESLAIAGHVELGEVSFGAIGGDRLPARAGRVVVLKGYADDHVELIAADPRAGELLGRWRRDAPESTFGDLDDWSGGVAFTTSRTISVVRGDTGELLGRAVHTEASSRGTRYPIGGDTLWILPSPLVLGRRAPRLVSLAGAVPDEVRDAVLLDVVSAEERRRPN